MNFAYFIIDKIAISTSFIELYLVASFLLFQSIFFSKYWFIWFCQTTSELSTQEWVTVNMRPTDPALAKTCRQLSAGAQLARPGVRA